MKELFSILILLVACSSPSKKGGEEESAKLLPGQDTTVGSKLFSKDEFQGIWTQVPEGTASFEVTGDSIRYVDSYDQAHYYFIVKDTIAIDLEGYLAKTRIVKLSKDTLIWINAANKQVTYLKRR